jgi:hypothetical protein
VSATFENLAGDMARGQGEHLTALAILLGVPTNHQQMFFTLAQERYRELIGRGKTSPSALIKRWLKPSQDIRFLPKSKRRTSARESVNILKAKLIFL